MVARQQGGVEGTSVECCQWQEARDQHIFILHVRLEEDRGWLVGKLGGQ